MDFSNTEITEKGAKSYSLDGHDPRVILFSKSVRGIECAELDENNNDEKFLEYLLRNCWEMSPLDTLRLIFYIRDCREGKGEKKIFDASCMWLISNHPGELSCNIQHIPFYGSWKDLPRIFGRTSLESAAIHVHTNKLRDDQKNLENGKKENIDVGAAKFAPSEGCEYDKKWKAAAKYAKALSCNKADYRKKFLRPLRSARVQITEELMCSDRWDKIDFSQVPSIAMKTYKKAFSKHQLERYRQFLLNVRTGAAKINTSTLTPVEIVGEYISISYHGISISEYNDALEAQWSQFLFDRSTKRRRIVNEACVTPSNALAIIDTSGSMFDKLSRANPISVAVATGLLISLLNDKDSPFYRKWITFSDTPKMETMKGESLHDHLTNLNIKDWGYTTNFQTVFDLILETASCYHVPPGQMPKMLIVISDMQFDRAANPTDTNWEDIEKKYKKYGYERPFIVFWNVVSNTHDTPIPHSSVPKCVLVSGYSANILDSIIDDGTSFTPLGLMRKVIDSPRYSRITLFGT